MAQWRKGTKMLESWGRGMAQKKAPKGMHMVWRAFSKREQRRAKRLEGAAELEAKKRDIVCLSRMMVAKKLNWVKEKLKNMKSDHCSLIISM